MKKPSFLSGFKFKNPRQFFEKYKFLLLVMCAGALLLLLPTGSSNAKEEPQTAGTLSFSLEEEEEKIQKALAEIEGAGKVRLVLTLKNNGENYYLQDSVSNRTEDSDGSLDTNVEQSSVILSKGSGQQEAVIQEQRFPVYQGALVICEGASNQSVCLEITQAVAALTGLRTDKISVVQMQTK